MRKARQRVAFVMVLAGAVLAGCGSDVPLSNMGHMTERWIGAAPSPTMASDTVPVSSPVGVLASEDAKTITWVNEGLGDPLPMFPDDVVAAVWARSSRQDRFVQASRAEIAAALPGLRFPELIPENAAYITSQLIFDPAAGRLAADPVAAFGFWSVKPYSKSRSVAQLAVLMVAVDEAPPEPVVPDTIGVPEDPQTDTGCDELAGGAVEVCRKVTLEEEYPAWSLDVTEGWRLVWSGQGYRYDLFVRDADSADLLARMAGSCAELVPMDPVPAGSDGPDGSPVENQAEPLAESSGS